MARVKKVFPNFYRDSVSLMQVSAKISARSGVTQASAVMASEANLELLREAGLLDGDGTYRPSDLLIVMEGEDEALADALAEAEALLSRQVTPRGRGVVEFPPRSIEMALSRRPAANLVLISTPGEYAAAEAEKALRLGLNVMMFSDNVALDDEVRLKALAASKDLILMGPDCGTAIVDGVPLGFANAVRRGAIGIVAASGTGLQQVTCLVDRRGKGISQAIGTGGRDLRLEVGGGTMLRGLARLAADPETKVIVLVSKPPAQKVADLILEAAAKIDKPVVVNFLGADLRHKPRPGTYAATTLEEAAAFAVLLADGREPDAASKLATPEGPAEAVAAAATLAPEQQFVRGLYTGGTFCFETLLILSQALGPVYSNTPLQPDHALDDPWTSREHTVIDLGDDNFTRGRPHPMIDPTLRNERIVKEASDPAVAVILLDVVLGYGSHSDPATDLVPSLLAAQKRAAADGRQIAFVASVCGTRDDPQGLVRQETILREAGVLLTDSNAAAARLALRLAIRDESVSSGAAPEKAGKSL